MKLIDLVRNFDEEMKIKVIKWIGIDKKEEVYYEGIVFNLSWWIAELQLDNESADCNACYIDEGTFVAYIIGE